MANRSEKILIYVEEIEVRSFKGIESFSCSFSDLTLLVGLNNAGKTSLLQAISLVCAARNSIGSFAGGGGSASVQFDSIVSAVQVPDLDWLFKIGDRSFPNIRALFSDSLVLDIWREGISQLGVWYEYDQESSFTPTKAQFVLPPGLVAARELWVNEHTYSRSVSSGTAGAMFRNSIWWSVQTEGFEQYEQVKSLVREFFPNVELLMPTQSHGHETFINIGFKEDGLRQLDIAQSGAGLRTFLALARAVLSSSANVLLLDEPDAHLHASLQAVVGNLLLSSRVLGTKQIILSSHSPELIARVPAESLRWVEPASTSLPTEPAEFIERLGADQTFFVQSALPDRLAYVEGVEDKPIIEALIRWCRSHCDIDLPSTMVVPHRNGRFELSVLEAIRNFAVTQRSGIDVCGIRDLDWYYTEPPEKHEIIERNNVRLLTLACKELENLMCHPALVAECSQGTITEYEARELLDEISKEAGLINDWKYQVAPKYRKRLGGSVDESTKERKADEAFHTWMEDPLLRQNFVAGKILLRRYREALENRKVRFRYSPTNFDSMSRLSADWLTVAEFIFPEAKGLIPSLQD